MFKHLKVQTKLILLAAIAVLGLAGLEVFNMSRLMGSYHQSVAVMEKVLYKDYDEQIKGQVQNVITMLDKIYAKQEAGEYTETEAKKLAADLVRELRYGENGYF